MGWAVRLWKKQEIEVKAYNHPTVIIRLIAECRANSLWHYYPRTAAAVGCWA